MKPVEMSHPSNIRTRTTVVVVALYWQLFFSRDRHVVLTSVRGGGVCEADGGRWRRLASCMFTETRKTADVELSTRAR